MLDNKVPIDNQQVPVEGQPVSVDGNQVPVDGQPVPVEGIVPDNIVEEPIKGQPVEQDVTVQLNARIQELEQESHINGEKVAQLDTLTADLDFQNFLLEKHRKLQAGQQEQVAPVELDVNFDEYEGGEVFKQLGDAISKNVAEQINSLRQEFAPMKEMVSNTRAQSEWATLVNTAQQQGWDDPQKYKKAIDFTLQKYPGMSIVDAYDIVKGSMARRPTVAAAGQQQVTSQQAPTVRPGGTSVVANPIVSTDSLEEAQKARKEGKPRRSITEILVETTNFLRK